MYSKRMKNRGLKILIYMLVSGWLAYASAETSFHTSEPSNKITASQAAKSKSNVFKCQKVHQGPNINPVNVKGSKPTWHSKVGNGIDNAGELLADNKTVYQCKEMLLDASSARMKTAQ